MMGRNYDKSGYYTLRDRDGKLFARGDLNFCIQKLGELQPKRTEFALRDGWTIEPTQMCCVTGSNILK
jgi:hypothetical protein